MNLDIDGKTYLKFFSKKCFFRVIKKVAIRFDKKNLQTIRLKTIKYVNTIQGVHSNGSTK